MAQLPVLIILAGGASSRMWPLREKSLMSFGYGEPLLLSQLRRYQSLGFKEAVIVGNPHNASDMQHIIDQMKGMTLAVAIQSDPKGMGDALLQTADHFANRLDTSVYILQVHDVVDDTLHKDLLAAYQVQPDTTFLAGMEMSEYFPGGYLIVGDDGVIQGMVEKPGAGNEPSNLVQYRGAYS